MAEKYSIYSMKRRLLALSLLVIFFICAIIGRFFFLQVSNSYSYIEKGLTQWLRDLPLTAKRGSITDRNGITLASSYTTFDVYVRPADVTDVEGVSLLLSNVLGIDYDTVIEKVMKKNQSEVRIEKDIEKSTVQQILKNMKDGIFFTTNTERYYEYDSILSQIIGFVGSDNAGQTGLEAYYNAYLAGIDGVSLVEADLKGTTLHDSTTYYEDAIDGLNIALTIDFRIQYEVEKILKEAMNSTGAKSITCVVTDPNTNEILALSTLPSYDLNNVPRDNISTLNALSRATAITDTFEPGSTFKAIVAAIAVQEGLAEKHSYFYCSGYRIINGVRIRCSRRTGHGSQTLEQGLMNSCNCVFMDLIQKIGVKKFYEYLDKLGFISGIGIDFPGEVNAVLMPMPDVTAPDLARMGFGQTIALSAMQMMTGISAVINGGKVVVPHFLKSISNSDGLVYYNSSTTVKNTIFSESTSSLMREMLFSVVSQGGGRYAKVDNYDIIGGKTGTAQKYENGAISQGKYIASFIGFAPYDCPKYLVYVIVDEPQGAYYGGVVAAPIAKIVFEKIFKIKEIKMIDEGLKSNSFKLPSFIGKTATEAASQMSSLKLQYLIQGSGDYVTSQIPAPDIEVNENDIVLLIFDN